MELHWLTRGLADFSRWLGKFLIGLGVFFALLWLTDTSGRGERAFFALAAVAGWAIGGALWTGSLVAKRLHSWHRSRRAP